MTRYFPFITIKKSVFLTDLSYINIMYARHGTAWAWIDAEGSATQG